MVTLTDVELVLTAGIATPEMRRCISAAKRVAFDRGDPPGLTHALFMEVTALRLVDFG